MNFEKFKVNYIKTHGVKSLPSDTFVLNNTNFDMETVIGTEAQLKQKRIELTENNKKLYDKMITEHHKQNSDIEKAFISEVASNFKNKAVAEQMFYKLIHTFGGYTLEEYSELICDFAKIIEAVPANTVI